MESEISTPFMVRFFVVLDQGYPVEIGHDTLAYSGLAHQTKTQSLVGHYSFPH